MQGCAFLTYTPVTNRCHSATHTGYKPDATKRQTHRLQTGATARGAPALPGLRDFCLAVPVYPPNANGSASFFDNIVVKPGSDFLMFVSNGLSAGRSLVQCPSAIAIAPRRW